MTPLNRARLPVKMETDDSTPEMGNDRTELIDEWPPLRGAEDEEVAAALFDAKDELRVLALQLDDVLVNGRGEIEDSDVADLLELGNDLRGLAANLAQRSE